MTEKWIRFIHDDADAKSVKEAQTIKARLEKRGYTFIDCHQIGINKWKWTYKKVDNSPLKFHG